MYRIQAYNLKTQHIEIIIVHSMDERMRTIKELKNNQNYGLITFESSPRGAFYR